VATSSHRTSFERDTADFDVVRTAVALVTIHVDRRRISCPRAISASKEFRMASFYPSGSR